jgi:hypothetical protein
MKHLNSIVIAIFFHATSIFGQGTPKNQNTDLLNYKNVKYEIINIDTLVNHYTNGKYNTPDFKMWDSTKIWADIILMGLPKKIDSTSLRQKVLAIMKSKGINKASVFRDRYSSMLARLSSLYAYKKLKERDGYLGVFNLD